MTHQGCAKWDKATYVMDTVAGYSGLSSNTSVLTKNGVKQMDQLIIGD